MQDATLPDPDVLASAVHLLTKHLPILSEAHVVFESPKDGSIMSKQLARQIADSLVGLEAHLEQKEKCRLQLHGVYGTHSALNKRWNEVKRYWNYTGRMDGLWV